MAEDLCYCGGQFEPATVTLKFREQTAYVPGYRCASCGEEIIDAKVSMRIRPGEPIPPEFLTPPAPLAAHEGRAAPAEREG